MSEQMTYVGRLVVEECHCGIKHAIPEELWRQAKQEGKVIYCPLGHEWHFVESDVGKLKAQLASAHERVEFYRGERDRIELRRRSMQSHFTRIKNRVAKGVCPCCNRQFKNLASHMKVKHPSYQVEQ